MRKKPKMKGERLTHRRRIAVVGKQKPREIPEDLDRYVPDESSGYVFKNGLLRLTKK